MEKVYTVKYVILFAWPEFIQTNQFILKCKFVTFIGIFHGETLKMQCLLFCSYLKQQRFRLPEANNSTIKFIPQFILQLASFLNLFCLFGKCMSQKSIFSINFLRVYPLAIFHHSYSQKIRVTILNATEPYTRGLPWYEKDNCIIFMFIAFVSFVVNIDLSLSFLFYTPISVLTMSNYFSWIALCPFSFLFSCSLPCSSPPFLLFLPLLCSSLPLPFHPFVMSPSAGVVAVPPQYVQHAVPTPRPTRLWDPPHIPSTFTFSFSSTGFLEVT